MIINEYSMLYRQFENLEFFTKNFLYLKVKGLSLDLWIELWDCVRVMGKNSHIDIVGGCYWMLSNKCYYVCISVVPTQLLQLDLLRKARMSKLAKIPPRVLQLTWLTWQEGKFEVWDASQSYITFGINIYYIYIKVVPERSYA